MTLGLNKKENNGTLINTDDTNIRRKKLRYFGARILEDIDAVNYHKMNKEHAQIDADGYAAAIDLKYNILSSWQMAYKQSRMSP